MAMAMALTMAMAMAMAMAGVLFSWSVGDCQNWYKIHTPKIYNLFILNLYQPGTIIGLKNSQYKIPYLPWNQYHDGPAKTVHGGDGGNSVGGVSGGQYRWEQRWRW
jgi:hypothetical protein